MEKFPENSLIFFKNGPKSSNHRILVKRKSLMRTCHAHKDVIGAGVVQLARKHTILATNFGRGSFNLSYLINQVGSEYVGNTDLYSSCWKPAKCPPEVL